MAHTYTIFVTGLEAYCHHGASDEEQVVGHRYVADFELDVTGTAPDTDSLNETVDYSSASQIVLAVLAGRQHRTLEKLALRCLEALLGAFPLAHRVRIRLSKRLPPLGSVAELAGVELTSSRPVTP